MLYCCTVNGGTVCMNCINGRITTAISRYRYLRCCILCIDKKRAPNFHGGDSEHTSYGVYAYVQDNKVPIISCTGTTYQRTCHFDDIAQTLVHILQTPVHIARIPVHIAYIPVHIAQLPIQCTQYPIKRWVLHITWDFENAN